MRLWNALAGPLMWGYDAWGHVAYALFIDVHHGVPWADQGWSYFHPPFHYLLGAGLAQLGSGALLMRGLALWGSAASLGTAALSAWVVRGVSSHTGLPLLAFVCVAFLPVHLFVSPMPGNEMTLCFLSAAALAAFIANQRRPRPSLALDVLTGALLGLALLTKFSGLLPLLALLLCLGLRGLELRRQRGALGRVALRAALLAGVALALATPYYQRNVSAFGTPFQLSRDFPLVADVERGQPPGQRTWRDYVHLSTRTFSEPDPRAPHLHHSVWGATYLNVWADVTRESLVAPTPQRRRTELRAASSMAWLGLAPTGLALAGAVLAGRDAWRGRRRATYVPLLVLSAVVLTGYAAFALRVPQWSALKGAYLLGLSVPYGAFAARGVEALGGRRRWAARLATLAAVAAAAVGATLTGLEGLVLPVRGDSPAAGAVHFHFGEYEAARRLYGRLATRSAYPVPWLENLAAVEAADGRPERARKLYARAAELARAAGRRDAYREGRWALATALAGDAPGALRLLDQALEIGPLPELLANRGAVRATLGDPAGAERDLLAALDLEPALVPAWLNLATLRQRAGRAAAAGEASTRAAREACRPPRRYPYGLGTGEILEWGVGRRFLLLLEGDGLALALPDFYRGACATLRAGARRQEPRRT